MEKIFLSVLNMSLTGTFVIVAITLARLPLKKAPKIISYALWAVAGFRLVFPFSIQSVFSLLPFKAAPIPQDIGMQAIPRINSGIKIVDNAVSAILPAAAPASSVNPLQIWLTIGSYIWLFGIAIMLIYSFVSIVLLKHKLRGTEFIEGNIYEADNLRTPFVIGLFRSKIYIPAGLSDKERRYIVLHEQTHIRRHDHAVKMLAYFVLCLHWFNPLVWIAFILMGADMEMSCDERVMKELGEDIKNAYSLSLVRVAAGHKILNGSPLAFGEGGMKERVKNVLNFKKHSRVIVIAAQGSKTSLPLTCLICSTKPTRRITTVYATK
ncbi:peptidase M56 BlaR1 [Desulfofarcimen acetoxidans DSM 771]|uniref:Peptidase M56 BlaR1 n=1 Tax=Desulfofarcimen acetoxidans (strain ATCC 49208 / DSM 771 / KCTC 5769 / VKM B-1644 / 5575) TaxID=485916 RepID=C8W6T1_DESAS|nr:peptidase M56 BlaR1 [Desulfofarcimen acetoxidans]ACV64190.1 peptidase M56 BlaR1 [Desulfofarcimen acetoxidans DSM 771]